MSAIPGRKILVVDDNADGAQSMAFVLRALGHDAEYLSDARRVMGVVRERKPDAVFLDINMPHLDGYQLAAMLKRELNHVHVVAITGHDSPQDRKRGREAGFDAYVAKPADASMLESILATIFGPRAPR